MLDNALDYGILEERFWEMTFAEIERAVKSAVRIQKLKAKEKASYDYILATLITKGVAKAFGDKSDYPTLEEVYPEVFSDDIAEREAKAEEQKMNLSAIRFRQFAQSFNKGFKKQEVANQINE